MEPNPFEQSFSSKPSGQRSASPEGNRSESQKSEKKLGHKPTKSDVGVKQESDERSDESSKSDTKKSSGPVTPGQSLNKRILPPVSSITSPAAQDNALQYPWNTSLSGSLRAGPLSPAMLAGPQSFDPSTFRTGFTPDLSNFKTGLTPLGATSGSFPPPSPNTAAFLAMMNNNGTAALSGAPITPNTLSALSGNPIDTQNNGGSIIASQPAGSNNKEPGEGTDTFGYFGRHVPGSSPKAEQTSNQLSHEGKEEGAENAQQAGPQQKGHSSTKQAASGLFLLSQAHQELSKREETAAAASAAAHALHGVNNSNMEAQTLYDNVPSAKKGKGAIRKGSEDASGGKRKKSGSDAASSKNGAKKVKNDLLDGERDTDAESDELDEEFQRRKASGTLEEGTEEDKRKNFLERNRQAALKCRQRKKAWLASLQAKVEYLQSDNEGLQGTVGALRNEVMFLKSQLMQAQRQLAANGMGAPPSGVDAASNGMSRPMDIPGMMAGGLSHLPPHGNIHAMAAAAAANTGGQNGPPNIPGQYQAQGPSRQPAQQAQSYNNPSKNHARQGSIQAV